MDDLSICKRIADIERIHYMVTKYTDRANFLGLVDAPDGSGTPPELIGEYNPLTDDALCFQLLKKYKVDLWRNLGLSQAMIAFNKPNPDNIKRVSHEDYNKAICLAIIEANKTCSHQ